MAGYFALTDGADDLYGAGRDGYRDGTPPSTSPTVVAASHLNMWMREINNFVEMLGGTPNTSLDNQMGTQALLHLDDIKMRARWGNWLQIIGSNVGTPAAEANAGFVWGAEHGRVIVYGTTSGMYRIVNGAAPVKISSGINEYDSRFFPSSSGRLYGYVHGDPPTTNSYYSGGESGTISSGSGWLAFPSVAGPTSSGIMRKRETGWQIEDGNNHNGDDTAFGTAPALTGTYSGLFYANGRVTVLSTTKAAYTDDSGANWTIVTHGATPPGWSGIVSERDICQASIDKGASSILMVSETTTYTVSTDNGQTWTTNSNPGGIDAIDMVGGGGEIAMLGSGGSVYVTRDGLTWSQRYVPANTYRIFIEDFGPAAFKLSRVYALTSKGIFLSSAT